MSIGWPWFTADTLNTIGMVGLAYCEVFNVHSALPYVNGGLLIFGAIAFVRELLKKE